MSTINQFNKQNLAELRIAINAAIATVATKYDINLSIGKISFDDASFRTQLSASTKTGQTNIGQILGLPELGKEFTSHGRKFIVTGHNSRSQKYPVEAKEIETGKSYKFQAAAVK